MHKPLLAVTMGDPAGIDPEVIVAALTSRTVQELFCALVVGHREVLRRAAKLLKVSARIEEVSAPDQALPSVEVIPCLLTGSDDVLDVTAGTIDARAGQAAYDALVAAARLALTGQVAA